MAASYPTSVKTFSTKATNDVIEAAHVNEPQDEITALETALLTSGLAHTLIPAADDTYDLGSAAKQWRVGYFDQIALNGVTYTPPSADGSADQALTTNGSATLSWATVTQPRYCEGRLTLTTAVPVTTSDVTAAGTIYFTPYKGNRISLYSGTAWVTYAFTEKSLALTATSGKPYDVFIYDNSGTPTLEILVWTDDTNRATALTLQDGILVKTGATTRRYLGSFYATGANQTEDSVLKRYLWNYYNRVPRPLRVAEATNTWTYDTATYRQANAAAGNQVSVMIGWAEDSIDLTLKASMAGAFTAKVGIGQDSTTTVHTSCINSAHYGDAIGAEYPLGASLRIIPAVGQHDYVWLEWASAATVTFFGDNGGTLTYSGMNGIVQG